MKKNPAEAVSSLIGPLQELYMIAFLAEGENAQERIEKALKNWAEKWLVSMEYDDMFDGKAFDGLSEDEKKKIMLDKLTEAKRRMSEMMVMACCAFQDNPVQTVESIQTGTKPDVTVRRYSMFALRKWEK